MPFSPALRVLRSPLPTQRRGRDVLRRSASAGASARFGGFERGGAPRVADSSQGDDGISDAEMGGFAELRFVRLRDVDQLVLAGRRGRTDRGVELALVHEQNDRLGVDVCRNATHEALLPAAVYKATEKHGRLDDLECIKRQDD
jgi:hypothetical protein